MLTPNQVLNNRYKIHVALGQGGFGAVYKGWDDNLQRHCAIKENLQVGGGYNLTMKCLICQPGFAAVTLQRQGNTMVIKDVPTEICT